MGRRYTWFDQPWKTLGSFVTTYTIAKRLLAPILSTGLWRLAPFASVSHPSAPDDPCEIAVRGLIVSPLDIEFVRNLYEVRAVLDGLAARCAAEHGAARAKKDGPEFIAHGRAAVESGSLSDQIAADMNFHAFVTDLSGNPLIGETTAPHWPYLRRVMGEVLRDDEKMPQNIWDEHAGILEAIQCRGSQFGRKAQPPTHTACRRHLCRASTSPTRSLE